MMKPNIKEQAQAHMGARWKYLGEKGWHGRVGMACYFAANRGYVEANIAAGRIPDGEGSYRKP